MAGRTSRFPPFVYQKSNISEVELMASEAGSTVHGNLDDFSKQSRMQIVQNKGKTNLFCLSNYLQ